MATMLPPVIDESTVSDAERRVFALMKHAPDTDGWVVLHSLGLSHRGRKPYGEIDFVVLIPGEGVLCIEVKGGRIACRNGEWETTDRNGTTRRLNRSPFLQAREGMFALRDVVNQRTQRQIPDTLVFAYAVVMPDIRFALRTPEWESWQIIDRDSLLRPLSTLLRSVVRNTAALLCPPPAGEPTAASVRIIKQRLRPDFELVVARTAQIEQTEEKLLQLTEGQYATLDMLTENSRCLVSGAAGTGKTMLALEFARRAALSGGRTLFICFNRLLGDWLERQCSSLAADHLLTAGSYHKLLREVILDSPLADEFKRIEQRGDARPLFAEAYPEQGALALAEKEPYDVLVVDEAQDLLSASAVDVLNVWLRDGLSNGRWAIFGDFERQAIFGGQTAEELKANLAQAAPEFTRAALKVNCRNSRNIGQETALLSGFDAPPYRMGQVLGLPVDYRYYRTPEAQCGILNEVLRSLLAEGVRPRDVVVLSEYKLANSGIAGIDGGRDFHVAEMAEAVPATLRIPAIRFATAQAFKGMESPVIILCDVERVTDAAPQSLLYVAMSRARAHLILLVDESLRPAVADIVRAGLQAAWR